MKSGSSADYLLCTSEFLIRDVTFCSLCKLTHNCTHDLVTKKQANSTKVTLLIRHLPRNTHTMNKIPWRCLMALQPHKIQKAQHQSSLHWMLLPAKSKDRNWSQVTSHRLQVTSYRLQVTSHKSQVTSRLQVTSHKSQVTSHKLQVTSHRSQVTSRLQVTSHKLQVTSH